MDKILSKKTGISEITNREDLINALTIGSQLEHGLMLMYLYAAYSIKSLLSEIEGTPDERQIRRDKIRNWEGMILRVARQEMEHLGFVCNMLSAIGGAQYFDRPNFPQLPKFWSTDLPIELERFCPTTLFRFMMFEKPAKLHDPLFEYCKNLYGTHRDSKISAESPQPQDPDYRTIGELYDLIRTAFKKIPQESLFIVPPDSQVDNDKLFGSGASARQIYNMKVFKVWDRVSAVNAVNEIVEQGEGTDVEAHVTVKDLDPECHYMQFRRIFIEYVLRCDPDNEELIERRMIQPHTLKYEAARACVRNPALQLHQDTLSCDPYDGIGEQPPMSVAIIDDSYTKKVMGVANASYETLVQLLIRLYAGIDDSSSETFGIVQTVFFPYMTMVVRPLAELLSRLPAFKHQPDGPTAGMAFEYYRTIGFLPYRPAAWIYLHERMESAAIAFAEASNDLTIEKRAEYGVDFIGQNLKRIADDFKTYMGL